MDADILDLTDRTAGKEASSRVALVHDYLTQRGGAERVVLAMAGAFPAAPLYTSLYHPGSTFPAFRGIDVRTSPIDRAALLRRHHRLAFPLLAPAMSRMRVDADIALCSSSGWAHGVAATGRKIVYCHTPARWLYQSDRYLEGMPSAAGVALRSAGPLLRRWDVRAARSADCYLVNSTVVRDRVRLLYQIEPEVLPPPMTFQVEGEAKPVEGLEGGFMLSVSRLLPYKNVGPIVDAFRQLPAQRLVVAGAGPLLEDLRAKAPANVTLLGAVDDATLRWLYRSCLGLVAASYEDFGLTPVEAAAFGKPTTALRWGGFLDTVIDGVTGTFFDEPSAGLIASAISELLDQHWDPRRLIDHAERFSTGRFQDCLRKLVSEVIRGESTGRKVDPSTSSSVRS